MCGICGILDSNKKVDQEIITGMREAMLYRGPDDAGIYLHNDSSPFVGLGHRRLSIIDLSPDGHQPMSNEDSNIWIVFNGEIYNFKELNKELKDKGHQFRSHTDSETIIHLYEEYGEDCVRYLRGMFAFAIWDERDKSLFLARDRVGKKPLLYYFKNGRFCFASEFAALLKCGFIDKEVNYSSVDSYLSLGYVPSPFTIYKQVFKIPPAHTILIKDNRLSLKKYWDLNYTDKINISEEGAAEEILRLLKEAVKIRLHSDVPLGAFLSGGIDSSAVVALMSELSSSKVKTFSIGFREKDYSELSFARNIAERFGTEHREFIVRPEALKIIPLLIKHYGEPYADSSCIPTYYVSQYTKQYVTVALNGDGGDESFAGYERYQAMLISEALPPLARKALSSFSRLLPDSLSPKNKLRRMKRFLNAVVLPTQERYLKWVGIFDDSAKGSLYNREFLELINKTAPGKVLLDRPDGLSMLDSLLKTDVLTYLPDDLLVKVDIASMANSLEARSPFLDHKLMEFSAKLPAGYKMKMLIKKYILKKALKGVVPSENLYRKKMGFGVPVGEWFRGELKNYLEDTLSSKTIQKRGYFRPQAVEEMIKLHVKGKNDYSFQLWALLMLELWHSNFTG